MVAKSSIINSSICIPTILSIVFVYNCKNSVEESDYFDPKEIATHYNGGQFVGSTTCMECHPDIYTAHLETAHFNTSAIANSNNVRGSFEAGSNSLDFKDVAFRMKVKGDSLFQHTNIKNRDIDVPPAKFDIVIGSGAKGQSYLTWENNELYQLQVSYYTPTDTWVNSPGFPTYAHARPIGDACLKCHMTFATNIPDPNKANLYDRERLVYGVDCERCHRPGKKHVTYHRNNPDAKEAGYMMGLKELSRQRRLDICAQCHSGLRQELLKGRPFSFLSGDDLSIYSRNIDQGIPEEDLDVHGNQYGLLTISECFKKSGTMDCSTCHDPHRNQRGETNYFNAKCIACHNTNKSQCTTAGENKKRIGDNCIECHMPKSASKVMKVQLNKDSLETSFYVRTHLIGIHSDEQHTK